MKFIVSKLGKKAISIICALSIILSVVGVAFGTFASGGSEAAFGVYTVNADTAPAIPMFSLTQVDLAKTVEVKFAGDSAATKGEDITWTLLEGGENILTLDGTVVTAYKSGVYKLKAEAGGKTATLWIVVANQTDSAWNLYSIDFDKIAKENNYAGLTFVRGGNTTVKNASGGNSTYSTGEFKYTDANGTVTVDNANIPENLKFPTGWSAYTWALVNGPLSGDPEIQKIPFVMPYGHTVEGNASDSYVTRRDNVTSGIMPFDNPYKANLLGVGIDANTNIAYSLGLGDSHVRGYFVLNNEITQAFRDYKINANMDVAIASLISSNAVNRVGLFGRLRMNPNTGKPKTDMVYTINATKVPSNNASIAGTAGGNRYIWTAADYTNANWYGTFSEYKVSHVYFDVMLKNQMHPFQAIPGGVAMTGYGVNYSFRGGVSVPGGMDEANGVPYIRWDYLLNKNFNEGNQTNIRTNLQLSLTYEGDTATMSSPLSATSITFDNVYTDKGAVGVCIGSIDEANQYLNVHQFSIELLNDITAENNGTQYPYYTELDLYKVLATNPALPMYSATFVNKGDFAVQGEDSSMYLGSDLTFTFKNLDAEGNELDTPVIGVKDDVAAGRIYAYKKGAYKATVTETATGKKIAEIWVAVKDNKGEDWVLYDIDFDKIAADNEYDKLTFVESGETNTVASARTEEKYKYKTYITGALTYKGEEVTHANIPDALKLPAGWNTVIRGAEYGVITNWNKVPFVMPYSHTAVEGATPSYTRKVSTGLMPFDNPYAANGLGFDMNVPINVNSVLSEGGYTKGYFILNNDITKAFADYKVTADMDMASYNMVHGTFNSGYNMGIVGRLPVDENSIPTDVPFAGYSVTDSYSGSSFSTVSYNNTEKTGYTATTFLVNLRADNTNPCGVLKYDSYWHKTNRWPGASYIHGVTLKDGSALVAGTAYNADQVTLDTWKYLMDKNWRGDMSTGANVVLSVLYKGNTAVVSSPEDASGKTYTFDNVYSTAGAVGVVAPIISSGVSSTTGKSSDQQWISIHHFTLALANSDDEVPPYTAIPMLSEDNNTLTVNVNEGLALSEIAIVTDSAIPSGDTANWEFESANVTVAGGNLTATKAGYYNGKVTVGGKTLDIIIAVKAADGELNTILSAENGFEYITEAVDVDLAKYTLLVGGKYFAADEVTVTPEENSGITVAGGKLTAANTGYFTVTYTTAQGELAIVYAVKGNTDKYYKSDNFKFQMSADYIGAKNKYGTGGWNDNILISVDRTDSKAPYSQVLIVPDRIYNHYVEGDWVNIYTVGDSMYSGDYAKSTKALIIEKYIEKIGGYAFANFVNAESVELPERLKELGANAFENNAKLMEVTLPATLTKIGANAFAGCTSLSHVWVMNPDAVTIGAGAFPEGVTVHVIGGSDAEAAFQAAGYTTEALETTKANAFKAKHDEIMAIEAARATTVDVGTWYQCNNTQWKEHKGLEFYRFALSNRDAGVLHVPATIEWTDDKGVTDTYALTQPYINAFSLSFERDRIYEIVFPQIGYQFQMGICEQMSNLKKVTLPSGLTNLSQYDFYGTAIEEIVIPATVRNIDYNGYVFGDCTNLKSITFEDASRTAVFGSNNLSNSQVETLDLPVSVENVNRYVAKQATNLKRINFYNKDAKLVKNSSYEADDSANYFTEVAAGFTIGCVKGGWMDAYAKKYNIPVVYLDDQLENKDNNPDNYVITKNGNVNSITDYFGIGGHLVIPSSGNTAEEKNVPVYSITNTAFKYYLNKIRSVELSEGIISIGESAFANTPNLKSVKLPTSLKTIAKEAFLNSGITGTLEIPKNVATISNSAFAGNSGITDVYFYNAATVIGSDSIPETATIHGIKGSTAETYAEKMSMKFVEIPAPSKETAADVTDNKNYKFTIDENGVLTGYERVDDNKAYSLKVTIPAEVNGVKVTAIGANIFDAGSESSSVYAIEIAEGITAINDNAFKDNLKLTHVKLPKTLEKIGESAFEGTMLIGELEFGETFKDLGKNAFKGVNTLTSVTILNKACLIKSAALPRGVKTFTLYGYYNSTAMNFASRNSITFVSLDGEPSDTPSDEPTTPGDENVKDPTDDNVKDPIDEPGDIGEEPQDTIIYQYIEEDLTMVIILAVAMLGMMLLMGGGLIILVIIKTRQ